MRTIAADYLFPNNFVVKRILHVEKNLFLLSAVKMPKVLSFSTFLLFRSCVVVVVAPFYWGSIPFNENEMSELNGRMTSREVRQFNKLHLTFNIDQKPFQPPPPPGEFLLRIIFLSHFF